MFVAMVNKTYEIFLRLSSLDTCSCSSRHLKSTQVALREMYVLLEERLSWREEWRCATIRHGGLLVATTGTTGMQWLCADSCTTHQTVSTLTMNILAKQCQTAKK